MDTIEAIITAIESYMTADETLKAIVQNEDEAEGEVRLYHVWAPQDPTFPYLTHMVRPELVESDKGEVVGTYVLDFWDYGTNSSRAYSMRGRAIALLDCIRFDTEGGEAKGVRLYYERDYPLPQPEAEVWRVSSFWQIRYWRAGEIAAIQAR